MGEMMDNIITFKKAPPKEFDNLLNILQQNYEEHCPGISIFSPIRAIGNSNWSEIIGYHRGNFSAKLETTIKAIEKYLGETDEIYKESILYDELYAFNQQYEVRSPILTIVLPTNEQMWTLTFVWNARMYLLTDIYRNEHSMNQESLMKTMQKYNLTTESFVVSEES